MTPKTKSERLDQVISAIDEANAADPNTIEDGGEARPAELVYGERMTEAQERIYPDASEALRIAARAQHIRRWTVPRSSYPEGRKGYYAWRNYLKRFHADEVAVLMEKAGYSEEEINQVGSIIRKEGLRRNPDAQALEDLACVVFLEHYFEPFADKYDDDKLIDILRKTWAKMSDKGHAAALELQLPPRAARLVGRALAPDAAATDAAGAQ